MGLTNISNYKLKTKHVTLQTVFEKAISPLGLFGSCCFSELQYISWTLLKFRPFFTSLVFYISIIVGFHQIKMI